MKPIKAINIIDKGIAVFCPSISNYSNIRIEIFYSPKNPLFSSVYCQQDEFKIWEKLDTNRGKGVLFLYNSTESLKKGFYKIYLRAQTQEDTTISGQETYGLLKPKNTLHIGLPYSTFGHIKLT